MTTLRARPLPERLATSTASCADPAALARAVFDAVADHVPYAFACLATTDPASGVITNAFKSRPLDIGDEEFTLAEYGAPDINQFTEIARRCPPVGVLSVDTDGHPERCRRFRDFMRPRFGFTDELRVVCRARNATWAALAVYRGPGEPSFTAADGLELATVHEVIADAVQRTLFAVHATRPAEASAAVLIVDAGGRVTDLTSAAEERVYELGGWDNGALPASLLAVAALARRSGRPESTRVLGRAGRWLALQAMMLDGTGSTRSVVVTIDAAPPAAIGQLALAARGLTLREQEIAQLVLHGASTRVIATSLHLSPHTVQDHLKAVFRKLGVTSRREMIAQLVLD